MHFFFVLGIIFSLFGLFIIFLVIYKSLKIKNIIKKNPKQNNEKNLDLQKLIPLNLAGLFLSFIGMISLIIFFILS